MSENFLKLRGLFFVQFFYTLVVSTGTCVAVWFKILVPCDYTSFIYLHMYILMYRILFDSQTFTFYFYIF